MTEYYAQASSVHWQTPPEIVKAAREALGGIIGLDPCGPSDWADCTLEYPEYDGLARNWVKHIEDTGCARTALINPPFGTSYLTGQVCLSAEEYSPHPRPLAEKVTLVDWALKTATEAHAGMGCIWISKAAVETQALQLLMRNSVAVCFPASRVKYVSPDGRRANKAPTFPSVLIALGPVDRRRFFGAFNRIGVCL